MSEPSKNSGAVWDAALAWLLRVQAAPDDPDLRAALTAWLDADEAHAAAYRKAERVWQLTGHARIGDAPAREFAVPSRKPARRRRWAGAAAALAACLALVLVLAPQTALYLEADHLTAVGEVRQVGLADGSTVTLSADSAVGTDIDGGGRRVALLTGEAFFDVAADPDRPFSVTAGEVVVTVTGTSFDVRRGEDTVTVEVLTGSVNVRYGAGGDRLGRGDRLVVDGGTGRMTRSSVPPAHIAAWRNGKLVVERATIAEIAARIRPFHRGVLLIADDELRERRVSGVYDLRRPEAAARAAIQPHGGSVHAVSPYVLVLTGE